MFVIFFNKYLHSYCQLNYQPKKKIVDKLYKKQTDEKVFDLD